MMPARRRLSDQELLAAIKNEESAAYSYLTGELSGLRADAMGYYLGEPFGNEVEDRSQVVSHDVAETIEWIMPSLMRIFTGGDKILEFNPVGPEDVAQAEQETDYLNNVLTQQNNAFTTFYSWFQDALIQTNGYVKACWETYDDVSEEHYSGLADDEYAVLAADLAESKDAEIVEKVQRVEVREALDPQSMMPSVTEYSVWDCTVRTIRSRGRLAIYPVPPEEILVSTKTRSVCLQDAYFVQHRVEKTISEIRQMGYDIDDEIGDGADEELDLSPEATARAVFAEEGLNGTDEASAVDPSRRVVVFKETHIRIDRDGDGIAELIRVRHVGEKILDEEVADLINIAAITPIIMAHKHVGRSYVDLIKDLQLIKSTVLRQILDNLYLTNNGRLAISQRVNLQDTLSVRPGGIVRVEGSPAAEIMPIQVPNVGAFAFQALEYLDAVRENRTGITKYNQGLDANSLNKTASGISQIMGAAQQRIELVARIFAETGVKELFLIAHALTCKNGSQEEIVKLRNEWVPVSPRRWKKRSDVTVTVGMGTSNKDQMLQHLITIMQIQAEHAKGGLPTVQPINLYNSARKLVENAGFKQVDEFFTNPSNAEPAPTQQGPTEADLLLEVERMKAATAAQNAQVKADTDKQVAMIRAETERTIAAAKIAADQDLAALKTLQEHERATQDMDAQMRIADIGRETKLIAPDELTALTVLPQLEQLVQRVAQGQQEVATATVALASGQQELSGAVQQLMVAVQQASDSAAQRWAQAQQMAREMTE